MGSPCQSHLTHELFVHLLRWGWSYVIDAHHSCRFALNFTFTAPTSNFTAAWQTVAVNTLQQYKTTSLSNAKHAEHQTLLQLLTRRTSTLAFRRLLLTSSKWLLLPRPLVTRQKLQTQPFTMPRRLNLNLTLPPSLQPHGVSHRQRRNVIRRGNRLSMPPHMLRVPARWLRITTLLGEALGAQPKASLEAHRLLRCSTSSRQCPCS
jgi:hypothetical protein